MASASHMWICMRCACYVKGRPSSIRLDTEEHMCDSNAQQIIQNVTECMVLLSTIVQNLNSPKPKLSVSPMQTRRASKGTPSKSPDSKKTPAIGSTQNTVDVLAKSLNTLPGSTEKTGDCAKPTPPPLPPPLTSSLAVGKV